jgi:hypothetical protein
VRSALGDVGTQVTRDGLRCLFHSIGGGLSDKCDGIFEPSALKALVGRPTDANERANRFARQSTVDARAQRLAAADAKQATEAAAAMAVATTLNFESRLHEERRMIERQAQTPTPGHTRGQGAQRLSNPSPRGEGFGSETSETAEHFVEKSVEPSVMEDGVWFSPKFSFPRFGMDLGSTPRSAPQRTNPQRATLPNEGVMTPPLTPPRTPPRTPPLTSPRSLSAASMRQSAVATGAPADDGPDFGASAPRAEDPDFEPLRKEEVARLGRFVYEAGIPLAKRFYCRNSANCNRLFEVRRNPRFVVEAKMGDSSIFLTAFRLIERLFHLFEKKAFNGHLFALQVDPELNDSQRIARLTRAECKVLRFALNGSGGRFIFLTVGDVTVGLDTLFFRFGLSVQVVCPFCDRASCARCKVLFHGALECHEVEVRDQAGGPSKGR